MNKHKDEPPECNRNQNQPITRNRKSFHSVFADCDVVVEAFVVGNSTIVLGVVDMDYHSISVLRRVAEVSAEDKS